jgi:hypothetical protein
MIDIGLKTKVILSEGSNSILWSVVDFLDIIGKNILFIHSEDITRLNCNSIKIDRYNNWEFVKEKIMSNLFRLDMIIVYPNVYMENISNLIKSQIKLPTIYLTTSEAALLDTSLLRGYDNAYYFYKNSKGIPQNPFSAINISESDYVIKDLLNNWECSVEDLKRQYIRDQKIESLFKK